MFVSSRSTIAKFYPDIPSSSCEPVGIDAVGPKVVA